MKKPAKAKPFVPVPVGTQRRKHQRQLARMQHWQPQTFSQQQQQHRAAQHKAAAHHHHVTKVKTAKKRGWSPDGDMALCSARAFAESLRLATGRAVGDSAVLDVYWATAGDADAGASIWATAEAILAGGLGGRFLAEELLQCDRERVLPVAGLDFDQALPLVHRRPVGVQRQLNPVREFPDGQLGLGHGLILGLALPEPHAVAVDRAGGWWSWGEPFDPLEWPELVIEEAWAVKWLP